MPTTTLSPLHRTCSLAVAIGMASLLAHTSPAYAEGGAGVAKDPAKGAVLIGRTVSDGLTLQLEIEAAEGMWMLMGDPPQWGEHRPAKNERYHIEFKVTDNATQTRLPYADVIFTATNKDTGKTVTTDLPPMWGNSGLHYSENSTLAGDGNYIAMVTVGVPRFAREIKDKARWSRPVSASFHFKLKNGLLSDVSVPVPASN